MNTNPEKIFSSYQTEENSRSLAGRLFPSLNFYGNLFFLIFRGMLAFKKGELSAERLAWFSSKALKSLEQSGVRLHVTGLKPIVALNRPVVVVANHMSTLETIILPWLWAACGPVSFVLKESLMRYPVFRHVLASMEPVPVTRTNPRQDLKTVLEQGAARLKAGYSMVVFPQTRRSMNFVPEQFNSIGARLASRAGVPLVPLALQTHAWGVGRFIKDLGRIYPERPVYFHFGPPLFPQEGNAEIKAAHAASVQFIQDQVQQWASVRQADCA